MERKDESILQKLQQEAVPIPDSLLPENVKKRLEALPDTVKESHRQRISWRFLVLPGCCIAAAVLFLCLLLANSAFVENNTPQIEAVQNNISISAHHTANTMGNYITAYKKLKKFQGQQLVRAEKDIAFNTAYKKLKKFQGQQLARAEKDIALNSSAEKNLAISYNSADSSNQHSYSDTNIRTEGVSEADIVKTDGDYIYTCDKENHSLEIYQVSGDKVTKVSEISLKKQTKGGWLEDMYLSGDRLTVICTSMSLKQKELKKLYEEEGQSYENFNKASWNSASYSFASYGYYETVCRKYSELPEYIAAYTITYVYDISNRKEPALLHTFFQDGNYSSSRMSDGILYLFSQRDFNTENLNYKDITSYIPQIGGECVAAPDVTVPQKNSVNQYTCIAAIRPTSCEYLSKNSILGGTEQLYVSTDNIYLMDYGNNTSIIKLGYKEGVVTKIAEGSIKGRVLDDYATDEKNNHLRIVTTYTKENGKSYNGLFILDEKLKVTGKLTDLAENEEIYSARFIDDIAYFVTYENTDPLFAVDISNPSAPKLLGELKIPGFSEYLHPYGKHSLLGIGQETDAAGTWCGLKLSMFDITDPASLKETHKLVLPKDLAATAVTNNPNALFIDTEKNLFGLPVDDYNDNKTHYMVFSYDEEKGFTTLLDTSFAESLTPCRGLYIDDRFYVVAVGRGVRVFDLDGFERLN